MAEMLIQRETLTNMADKIRTLNGVNSGMTTAQMNSSLDEVNADVGSQADLITQIQTALEGKVAGSGGGGGASREPCSVTINHALGSELSCVYLSSEDNLPVYIHNFSSSKIQTYKNSILVVVCEQSLSDLGLVISYATDASYTEYYDGNRNVLIFFLMEDSHCIVFDEDDQFGEWT